MHFNSSGFNFLPFVADGSTKYRIATSSLSMGYVVHFFALGFNKKDNSMCNLNVKVTGVEIIFA